MVKSLCATLIFSGATLSAQSAALLSAPAAVQQVSLDEAVHLARKMSRFLPQRSRRRASPGWTTPSPSPACFPP
jgi:hypothetical protein